MDAVEMAAAIGNLMYVAGDDLELASALYKCKLAVDAIAWERSRVRHEAASAVRTLAKRRNRFVQRHKR